MQINIKKEVNHSILLMNDGQYSENHNNYYTFDKMMVYGGDNFSEVCDKLKVAGENAFVVTGSGEQTLETIKYGFSSIDSFDINLLARHILNLKKAAVIALSFEEFNYFFRFLFQNQRSIDLYEKIKPFLDAESEQYFRFLFQQKTGYQIFHGLFTHKFNLISQDLNQKCRQNFSFYNEDAFYQLKDSLPERQIEFIPLNIFDFHQIKKLEKKKYDFIYLSNIPFFLSIPVDDFQNIIIPYLISRLNPSGQIVLEYFHHFSPNCDSFENYNLRNQKLYRLLSSFSNCEFSVPSSGFGHGVSSQDYILALKK